MLDDPIKYGLLAALAIALLIAAFTDLRSRKIHNWLNLGIALGAPVFWWASHYSFLPESLLGPSVVTQLGIAVVTFLFLSVLFAMKWMGGGDVKLLTALALWIQWQYFWKLLVMMSLLGGLLTLVFGMWHIARRQRERLSIPYGLAIAAAGLWTIAAFYIPASAMNGVAG